MRPRNEAYGTSLMIEKDLPHRFIYLGDVYENGTIEDYANNYDPVFGKFKAITRPIPGNHDWHSRLSGYKNYWPDTKSFYSKEYGGWKLFFIDTNIPMAPGTPQYEWAKTRASEWTKPVIVFHHHHLYSAGGHGDQPQVAPLMDLFSDRLCLGVSGHTHNMQLFRQFKNYRQIVVGCGGREHYPVNESDARLEFSSTDYGALRMDLSPGRCDLGFFRYDGTLLYSLTVGTAPMRKKRFPLWLP